MTELLNPAWPSITAAFLGALVEAVEALTIVLAVATVRGWRPAGLGALLGLIVLCLIVVAFGPLLGLVPLRSVGADDLPGLESPQHADDRAADRQGDGQREQ